MTLKGACGNPQYIEFVESVVNGVEKELVRKEIYHLTQTILRRLAYYYDDSQILQIMGNIRENYPLKKKDLSCE